MKVGIIGSGVVGQELGKGLVKLGHEVKIGTRDKSKLKDWLLSVGKKGSAGSFDEAAKFGELNIIATSHAGTESAINLSGIKNFSKKVVIDVTNPLDFSQGMPPRYAGGPGNSSGEKIQKLLSNAKVVKAFNIISAKMMCNPLLSEGKADLFIAGNDKDAKERVKEIATDFSWENIIDMGDITKSHLLEGLAMLWIEYGFKFNNWTHGFKLMKK